MHRGDKELNPAQTVLKLRVNAGFSDCPCFRLRPSRRNLGRTRARHQLSHIPERRIEGLQTPPDGYGELSQGSTEPYLTNVEDPLPPCPSLDASSKGQTNQLGAKDPISFTTALNPINTQRQQDFASVPNETTSNVSVIDLPSESEGDQFCNQPDSRAPSSYIGESGYVPILSKLPPSVRRNSDGPIEVNIHYTVHPLSPALRVSYTNVFLDNCFTFCPILDSATLDLPQISSSLLLQQALALVGSVIQPSILHKDAPSCYYDNAKILLHNGYEPNPIASLLSVMLFYWWSTCPPHVVSMNGSWWWSGIAIRQAQELGFHREMIPGQSLWPGESVGLRRRIWWSLFARERVYSLGLGRPCIINLHDCNVKEPSRDDFPDPKDLRADIFVHWVQLSCIVGRVGDYLRCSGSAEITSPDLLDQLRTWTHGLPPHLRLLPFSVVPTELLERDIHLLHLPYLSSITLLHLRKSDTNVPAASIPAILSASCVARIFEGLLIRGSLRFLQGMAGWHMALAALALLNACQIGALKEAAKAHIRVLRIGLKELSQRWESAKMYDKGIEHLLRARSRSPYEGQIPNPQHVPVYPAGDDLSLNPGSAEGQEALKYFPGATKETSLLFETLLATNNPISNFVMESPSSFQASLPGFSANPFENFNQYSLEYLTSLGMDNNEFLFLLD
ncbi:hypothetical protein N7463_001514 [Penicillium fimorum]|uniref:Xylanolytic transcriptional activator regulatory domain-containing protein n=1 Tax=Penicillium fimorum TaxID=1882269 RepID=A0A9W9Y6H9_9EURO|nr:hypothetical protein N7463_001514 [Penicillium fimorum]